MEAERCCDFQFGCIASQFQFVALSHEHVQSEKGAYNYNRKKQQQKRFNLLNPISSSFPFPSLQRLSVSAPVVVIPVASHSLMLSFATIRESVSYAGERKVGTSLNSLRFDGRFERYKFLFRSVKYTSRYVILR
jgi:hypothetical protein